jgi:hypothetical protein
MLGVALVAGGLGFDDAHSVAFLAHPETLRIKSLVDLVGDPAFDPKEPRGAYVTILLDDGRTLEAHLPHPRGHRFREPHPGWDELEGKWDALLARRIGRARADEFLVASRQLESVDDVNDLVALLTPGVT